MAASREEWLRVIPGLRPRRGELHGGHKGAVGGLRSPGLDPNRSPADHFLADGLRRALTMRYTHEGLQIIVFPLYRAAWAECGDHAQPGRPLYSCRAGAVRPVYRKRCLR